MDISYNRKSELAWAKHLPKYSWFPYWILNRYATPRNCDEKNLYNPNEDRNDRNSREREIEIYGIPFAFRPQGFLLACVHTFPLSSFLPMHSARDIPARTAFQLEFSTCSPWSRTRIRAPRKPTARCLWPTYLSSVGNGPMARNGGRGQGQKSRGERD